MTALIRYNLPAAAAALLVVAFEITRALATGHSGLGTFGQGFGFAAAILGLLGPSLWLIGLLALLGFKGAVTGWRWGLGLGRPATRVAAALYAFLGIVALTLGVQVATIRFIKMFQRAIYQGLGAGLTAALILVVLVALAGPIVGLLGRVIGWIGPRLGPLDPQRLSGAALWLLLLAIGGSILAPKLRPELHTVDLRPARLALSWGFALWGLYALSARLRGWRIASAGLAFVLLSGISLTWTAHHLGDSQRRLVSVNRDTLLSGKVAARLSRLWDRDGDGVPRLFAGGDCDDTNPNIRPGVYDTPNDGVDQNCTGADYDRAADPLQAPPRPAPEARRPWNVLLLTLDAVRYDKFLEQMPRLRARMESGVNVEHGYSHGAATYWSLASLMTSVMPSRLHLGGDQTPVSKMELLTETLKREGWHTALFANVTVFFVRGLRQGTFVANYDTSHYTVHGAKPGSAHLTDGVLKHIRDWKAGRLRHKRDRFFVWAHYYDPHDPYFEVPGYPAEEDSDEARYDAILRYTDVEVGRLIDEVEAMGLLDSTLIVITADHGDEFLDHGHRFHGKTLYEEMVRVPLFYLVPGVGKRILEAPGGHTEIAPTILDLVGGRVPKAYQGRSRAEEILGGAPAPVEPVYFEVFPDRNYPNHQVGVRYGDLKLIYRIDKNTFELYDLAKDPKERDNLYDVDERAPALSELLLRYADDHLYHLGQGLTGAKLPVGAPPKQKAQQRKPRRKQKPARAKKHPPKRRSAPPPKAKPTPTPEAQPAPTPAPRPAKPAPAPRPVQPSSKPAAPAFSPASKPTQPTPPASSPTSRPASPQLKPEAQAP